jgi:hypothetical protein
MFSSSCTLRLSKIYAVQFFLQFARLSKLILTCSRENWSNARNQSFRLAAD